MPRAPRIEYSGAIYHVINRGNYRSWIFEDDGAKFAFEKCLFEACERSGWILHAYCIMGNHYHLAIETPQPNLSEGMRWLQSVYANRYNRYRKERGHLFQGRFKSILVGDGDRLAWLCHYIHLNPVRAGITQVPDLKSYPFSSYPKLFKSKARESFMSYESSLEGAGGLKDTPAGRRKYTQYLEWLNQDEQAQKDAAFEKMSKGWALATKDFKKAIIADQRNRLAAIETGDKDFAEIREENWASELGRCLKALGKNKEDTKKDRKSADWKVAIATHLKTKHLCKNPWLSKHLKMGAPAGVSRYCSELKSGKRKQAAKLLKILS